MSRAIWNPKGMRRSIRAGVNGGHPERANRSGLKMGAGSSPHYGGRRRFSHSPIAPRCLLAARYGRFTCDSQETCMRPRPQAG